MTADKALEIIAWVKDRRDYRRADGSRVPEWREVAALVYAGHDHDITPDNVLQLLAALNNRRRAGECSEERSIPHDQ